MRQFLMGLLFAVAVWWGYSVWFAKGADASKGFPAEGDLKLLLESGGSSSLDQEDSKRAELTRAKYTPTINSEDQADHPLTSGQSGDAAEIDRIVAGVQSIGRAEVDAAWRMLARAEPASAARQRIARAIENVKASEPSAALVRLGSNNDFLRSAEGRHLAKQTLEMMESEPDGKSVVLMTGLIDKCMRGTIEKQDTDPHAFVDLAWSEMKKRVDRFVCDPANVASSRSYTVASGDVLEKIAARFQKERLLVEAGTLALLNRIHNPNILPAGQKIKIPVEPISVVVEKRSFLMGVYLGGVLLRLYWVGHGADDKTPVAEFTVGVKQPNPDWYSPDGRIPFGDPRNILGKYFVKLTHDSYMGFGIHGTTKPDTIGTQASMGCIRMLDNDIEEFFRVIPRGAKVYIRDSK